MAKGDAGHVVLPHQRHETQRGTEGFPLVLRTAAPQGEGPPTRSQERQVQEAVHGCDLPHNGRTTRQQHNSEGRPDLRHQRNDPRRTLPRAPHGAPRSGRCE